MDPDLVARLDFHEAVWRHYDDAGRHDLPWRQPGPDGRFDPYRIMVSEIMLQQTQVGRVIPKYRQFLERFPGLKSLASASLGDALSEWNGLGYNRRAKFLWQAAGMVVNELDGNMPTTVQGLTALPGIGKNTAGAIVVYAYNQPAVFIETNVRTVFIAHFFRGADRVTDKQIADMVADTLPDENFREWYWALMDYGTFLKRKEGNLGRISSVYARQSAFQGSLRQMRGNVIKNLLVSSPQTGELLLEKIADSRLETVLADLVAEGLIVSSPEGYSLPE